MQNIAPVICVNKLTLIALCFLVPAIVLPLSSCAGGSQNVTTPGTTVAAAPVSSALPTPPSSARVFSSLEHSTGWQSCGAFDCAGGSSNATYWMAQNQTTPSLDGNSVKIYNAGSWANALWWLKLGANNDATNFLWDFYVQVDSASLASAQAVEFDAFQFLGGYNYMIGSQCDYGIGLWDVWDEQNEKWIPTAVPCPKFSPGVWHHIQWYAQRVPEAPKYRYVTLVVDGTPYSINQTYSAKSVGWSDAIGIQYQLDVNASGGGYPAWIDKSTLTVW